MINNDAAAVLLGSLKSTYLDKEESEFISRLNPAGITLFSRNINAENPPAIRETLEHLQSLRKKSTNPFLIAIDQEGGRVARLKPPFPNKGPALHLAEQKTSPENLEEIFKYANLVGTELLNLGINVDFAPVLDILRGEESEAIGDRAFGRTKEDVSLRAGAFLKGLNSSKIISCIKHFPGQGLAKNDTHADSAYIKTDLKKLENEDLFPFLNHLHISPLVMVAHCIYPDLDSIEASRSKIIMTNLLREKYRYNGLIVTDDMTMGAITKLDSSWSDLIVESVANGADLILICQGLENWEASFEALEKEASKSQAFRLRLKDAANRVNKLRSSLSNWGHPSNNLTQRLTSKN